MYECRCERLLENLKLRDLHSYTVTGLRGRLRGGLEHQKIETRLIDKRFESVMGVCVI